MSDSKLIETKDKYELIEDQAAFEDLIGHLNSFELLGVDFEGEWNLHRYGLHLCLIQVSDGKDIFLIDPVQVDDLGRFWDIMESPSVEIISHGPQSDFVLMDYLYGRSPRNVFDTEKAAQLLNFESTSLSYLLEKYFDIVKNTKVRVSNWNKRPITDKMLNYAAKDVAYLHELRQHLTEELKVADRYEWFLEECKGLEEIRHKEKEHPYLELNQASKLDPRQLNRLKHLYQVRDGIAAKLDRPAYHIIPNSTLVDLAKNPPRNAKEWSDLPGVNPRVRSHARVFHEAITTADNNPVAPGAYKKARDYNGLSKTAYFKLVDQKMELLETLRDQIKEDFDIYPMIISMRNVKKVAYGEATLSDFRDWQRKIIEDKAREMGLDISILQ